MMTYDLDQIAKGSRFLTGIDYTDVCPSTNTRARELALQGAAEGLLVLTGFQTDGRGRMGRIWEDTAEKGIAMSLVLHPTVSQDRLSMLTLVAAVAVHEALEQVCGLCADIKWPNDLLFHEKKLCGILTEGVICGKEALAILGIGLNVSADSFSGEAAAVATSVKLCTGKEPSREALICAIADAFGQRYAEFQEDGDLRRLVPVYNRFSLLPKGILANGNPKEL